MIIFHSKYTKYIISIIQKEQKKTEYKIHQKKKKSQKQILVEEKI